MLPDILAFNVFSGFLDDGSSPHWSEMTASCMLGLGLKDGEVVEAGSLPGGRPELSAACIHLGVRRVRPDLKTGRVAVQWNMAQKFLHLRFLTVYLYVKTPLAAEKEWLLVVLRTYKSLPSLPPPPALLNGAGVHEGAEGAANPSGLSSTLLLFKLNLRYI